MTVTFSTANFVTGGMLRDLPVVGGASWSRTLNKQDDITATLDLRDAGVRAAIATGAIDPQKSILFAEDSGSGKVVATTIILDHDWDNDKQVQSLSVQGLGGYFDDCLIGPASALTSNLTLATGRPNTTLDTSYSGFDLGTVGKKLIQQRLTWPGSPTPWVFTDDLFSPGVTKSYPFLDLRMVGSALTDIQALDGGPDMRFTSRRTASGLTLEYLFQSGSASAPQLGLYRGSWSEGVAESPVTNLKITRAGSNLATASWGLGAATVNAALWARTVNSALAATTPPRDVVDTSHSTATQAALNGYVTENSNYAAQLQTTLSFTLRANAKPGIDILDVGDMADLDISETSKFYPGGALLPIRITGISGTDKGDYLTIACVIWPRS